MVSGLPVSSTSSQTGVVLVAHHRGAVRVALQQPGAEAGQVLAALDLRQRLVDAAVGEHGRAAEAVGRVGAELGEEVVVGPHHLQVEVRVLGARHEAAGEAHREEHLGVDAVGDLLLDRAPWGRSCPGGCPRSGTTRPAASGARPAQASQPKPRGSKPSHTQASPCSTALDPRDPVEVAARTRVVQMSPGPFRCPSAEISLYSRGALSCQYL